MKDLGEDFSIRYYAHSRSDLDFLPYLEKAGVKYMMSAVFIIREVFT